MPVDFIKVTPGNTRSVRIVNATRFHGRHLDEDEELEGIEESEAYALVHCGKAVFTDTDSDDAEIDDPAPTKRTTKKGK